MTTGPFAESGRLLALGRESIRELVAELVRAASTARTGVLRVSGEPGGDLYIVHGQVVAIETPGAPGVRELLSRPGRTRGGAADLRVVALMATLDGAFALTSGWIGSCTWQELPSGQRWPDHPVPPVPGVEPGWLLSETERRLRALAHGRVSPHRNQLVLTDPGRALLRGPDGGQWADILLWVNGRHSCRDISMLLCRSLYGVTVEVVRLLDNDLVAIAPPVRAPAREPSRDAEPARGGPDRSALPRRRRGASGINDTLLPRAPQPVIRI